MLSAPPRPRQRRVKSRRCNRFNNPHHKTRFLLEFTNGAGSPRTPRAAGDLHHVPKDNASRKSRQRKGLHGNTNDGRDGDREPGPDRAPVPSLAWEHVHHPCPSPRRRTKNEFDGISANSLT